MPRKLTPDGRRVHVNVRLSEPEAAAIDSVRGDLERGPWMRAAALAVANGNSGIPQSDAPAVNGNSGIPQPERSSPVSQRRTAARQAGPKLRKKPDDAADAAIAEQDAVPLVPLAREDEPVPKRCKHKYLKLSKGVCPDCKEWVVK